MVHFRFFPILVVVARCHRGVHISWPVDDVAAQPKRRLYGREQFFRREKSSLAASRIRQLGVEPLNRNTSFKRRLEENCTIISMQKATVCSSRSRLNFDDPEL